jgi:predicted NAD/FAD-binding protein
MNGDIVAIEKTGQDAVSWKVTTSDGRCEQYDQVILAVWPNQAADILRQGLAKSGILFEPQPPVEKMVAETVEALAKVEISYCRATIHNDTRLMPSDRRAWPTYSYENIPYLKTGLSTIWSGQTDDAEAFTSYDWSDVPEGVSDSFALTKPQGPIHGVNIHIRTPPRAALYDAQAHIRAHQGKAGLWFTGSFMRETGYHEDGLVATIDILKQLLPDHGKLERLRKLLGRVPAG